MIFENPRRVVSVRIDDGLPDVEVDSLLPQFRDESLKHGRREVRPIAAVREFEDSAVLGNDAIGEVQAAGNAPQIIQDAAGNQYDEHARGTDFCEHTENFGIQDVVPGDRSVVVES